MTKPLTILAALGMLWLGGCQRARVGGEQGVDATLNALRNENAALREQVTRLEAELARRVAVIQRLEAEGKLPPTEVPGVSAADLPRFDRLSFGRYSGAIDSDNDQRDDLVRVYLQTLDQFGRFVPVAGAASIQAVVVRPNRDPQVLARRDYTAEQFQEAYRSGFLGTHYTLELPLPGDMPAGVDRATVQVTVTDAASGKVVSTEQVVSIKR